ADEDQGVRERIPEHIVVEQHLLVVIDADPRRRLERRPRLERQRHVPAERQEAVKKENRQRRRQEAGDKRQLPRALAPVPGDRRADHALGRPPAAMSYRSLATLGMTPWLVAHALRQTKIVIPSVAKDLPSSLKS